MEFFQLLVTALEEGSQRRILEIARLGPWDSWQIEYEALFDQIVGIGKCAVVLTGDGFYLVDVCLLKVQRMEPVTVS